MPVHRASKSTIRVTGTYLGKTALVKSGHGIRMPRHFAERVRIAMAPPSAYHFDNVQLVQTAASKCNYTGSCSLYYAPDIFAMATQISAGSPQDTLKYNIINAKLRYEIYNSGNSPMYMTVYECAPRHDIPYVAAELAGNVIQYPLQTLIQGFTDSNNAIGASSITSSPFQAGGFVTRYKILKSRDIKMVAGENMTLNLEDHSPMAINYNRWYQSNIGETSTVPFILYAARRSKFFLVKMWGGIGGTGSTFTAATTGELPVTFRGISRLSYEYRDVPAIYSVSTYAAGTDAAGVQQAPATTIVSPTLVVEQTGVYSTAAES